MTRKLIPLIVALPTAGTVTDGGGQISCGADCHGDYSYIKTCEDFECTTSSVDLVTLNASGAPGPGYKAFKRHTVYMRLVVKGVPAGATVSVSCKGKKCPARFFKKTRAGKIKLSKFIKKKLRPGTKLTIRVTKDGSIGKQFVIRIRKAKAPKLSISQIA